MLHQICVNLWYSSWSLVYSERAVRAYHVFTEHSIHIINASMPTVVGQTVWNWKMRCALQNIKLVENVKKLATKKNVTAGQMALAWLHHQVAQELHVPGFLCMSLVGAYLHAHVPSEVLCWR